MVRFETGDTVLVGKRKKVGNIIYFKMPSIAYVRFACERSSFVPITNLRKANGKLECPKIASKRKIKKREKGGEK